MVLLGIALLIAGAGLVVAEAHLPAFGALGIAGEKGDAAEGIADRAPDSRSSSRSPSSSALPRPGLSA